MRARRPEPPARVDDLFRSVAVTAGKGFLAQVFPKNWLTKEPAREANHVDGELPIILGGEEVWIYRRMSGWVG